MIFPVLYYFYGDPLAAILKLDKQSLLLLVALLMLLLEFIRIKHQWLFYGQRDYERNYPSAFFWSGIGIVMVLSLAPEYGNQGAAFGLPIIWSLCLGDPLLGESRRLGWPIWTSWLVTGTVLTLIWLLCAVWLGTPWIYSLWMPWLAIAAEQPALRWVDDNWMMQAIPLAALLLVWHFF